MVHVPIYYMIQHIIPKDVVVYLENQIQGFVCKYLSCGYILVANCKSAL